MSDASDIPDAATDAPERRLVEFDGLRGVAIALVLWHHLVERNLPAASEHWLGWLRIAGNLSWCGVDLFFVISGFFIGGILIDRRASPRLARVFYVRRALRILPLYYVTLLGGLLAAGAVAYFPAPQFAPWVYGLFLSNLGLALQGHWETLAFSVLWSLAVEEQFYLVAPWVTRATPRDRLPWLLAVLVALAIGLRVLAKHHFPDATVAIHVLTPLRMDALAVGVFVAWFVRAPTSHGLLVRLQRQWPWWLGGGTVLLAALGLQRPEAGSMLLAAGGYTFIAAFFGLVVLIVAGVNPSALREPLRWGPLVRLGRHSYFIYLWHAILATPVVALGAALIQPAGAGRTLFTLAAVLFTTLGAAAVSWKYFELPCIRLGRSLRY